MEAVKIKFDKSRINLDKALLSDKITKQFCTLLYTPMWFNGGQVLGWPSISGIIKQDLHLIMKYGYRKWR